jgi:peptide/nickel transport system substrate-binding protein
MKRINSRLLAVTAGLSVAVVGLTACAAQAPQGGDQKSGGSLVVNQTFDLKTPDPSRSYEPTGNIIDKAMYETLLTFHGGDVKKPVAGIADYKMNDDNTEMTLTINKGHKFSDGSEVTVDDAVFSLKRVQGIQGNPAFLLDGITVEKVDDSTMKLTSDKPNPALPFILPNPALSILNKKVVEENGGSDDADDKAEAFLGKESAGSGPYQLKSYDPKTEVVLEKNKEYSGSEPKYDRISLRNAPGETQALNVKSGEAQIALDLNPDLVDSLDGKADVKTTPSHYTIFAFLNQNAEVSEATSDPDVLKAAKLGINYDKIVDLAGKGAVRPGGPIPSLFNGSLSAEDGNQYDVDAAKKALAASSYNGEEITLNFPNDVTIAGLQLQSIAQLIQSDLKDIGMKIKLAPAPVATELDAYRGGTEQLGLWYWGPDFPDPSNYLVFSPGDLVGERAGWKAGADDAVTKAAKAARGASEDKRDAAYEKFQKAQNESGAFIPLVQPAQIVATDKSVSKVSLNPVWIIDLAATK